jgi:hypothetical protein
LPWRSIGSNCPSMTMPACSAGPALRPCGFSCGAGCCRGANKIIRISAGRAAQPASRWKSRKAGKRALRYPFSCGNRGPTWWRRARTPALRFFQRCGFLLRRPQANPNFRGPRRPTRVAVEEPQGWKASLALPFFLCASRGSGQPWSCLVTVGFSFADEPTVNSKDELRRAVMSDK